MHPIDHYRNKYRHICPIVILAPIQRCGSTLLQRMINAGGEAIVYGENFYLAENLPRSVGDIAGSMQQKTALTAPTMEKFLGGDRGIDATTLFPDYPKYAALVVKSFYEILDLYQEESEAKGFKTWGLKYQMRDAGGAHNFLHLLPNVRLVTITRNLIDVAKSYYARWPEQLRDEQAFAQLAGRWKAHNNFLDQIKLPHLAIRYEAFMQDAEGHAKKLQEATGVAISAEELRRKINIHPGDPAERRAQAREGGHYLPPQELPDYAVRVLQEIAA
jgi:hypothetical protein